MYLVLQYFGGRGLRVEEHKHPCRNNVNCYRKSTSWVLTKSRNDLKRPTTNKKRHERPTTSKKRAANNLQRARNDLKRLTISKTQLKTIRIYLQQAKKALNDQQQTDVEIVLQYGAIGSLL